MVPASQVAQASFLGPKRIGDFVPSSVIKIIRLLQVDDFLFGLEKQGWAIWLLVLLGHWGSC
jgi:hypothetical protein